MPKKIPQKNVFISSAMPLKVQDNTFFAGESFPEHQHEYFEIQLIVSGSLIHNINGSSVVMSPRDICLILPGDNHSISTCPGIASVHLYNICFIPELISDFPGILTGFFRFDINSEAACRSTRLDIPEFNDLKSRIELLRDSKFPPGSQEAYVARFYGLLFDVFSILEQNQKRTDPVPPEWLCHAREMMRRPRNLSLGLDRFVTLSARSQEHLTRCMKKYFRETPQGYINRLRIQNAAALLRNTKKSLDAIMYESGFRNISYFRRCFKKHFSTTPGRYRKQTRKVFMPSRNN